MKLFIYIVIFIIIIFIVISSSEYNSNLFSYWMSFVYKGNYYNKTKINSDLSLCTTKTSKFYVFNSDKIIGNVICKGNIWEEFMHKYFKKYSHPEKIALDIGANIGTHSLVLSRYFDKVYSFEPLFYDVLQKNMDINGISNVQVIPKGLSDIHGEATIKRDNFNAGASYITSDGDSSINLDKLDNFTFNKPIALMKIDVEGHELEVIRGGLETIRKHKPVIIIEIKNNDIFDLIRGLGYTIKRIMTEDYICIPVI